MNGKIKAITGRWIMMLTVLFSAILSMIVVLIIGRGGAISSEGILELIEYLVEFYLPLLGVMSAFYFVKSTQKVN